MNPSCEELKKENKLLKKKLEATFLNNKFDSFFKNNKAVMLEIDTETKKILDINQAAIDFYGFTKKEFLNKAVNDLNTLPPEEIKKLMHEAVKNKSNLFEFQHKTANGTIKDVEVYASPFSFGGKTHMFLTILDISEKKKIRNKLIKQNEEYAALNEEYLTSNEELKEKNYEYSALNEEYKLQNEELKEAIQIAKENEAKLRNLADLLPQAIYECDIEGNLTYVNDRAFEFFGYTKEDFKKGINIFQTLVPESHEKAKNNIRKVILKEYSGEPDYTALRKDGTTFPIQIYSSAMYKNGKTVGLRGVIIDTSLIKNQEQKIKNQNKKLKIITEIEKIGTFDLDLKTNLTTWNDEMFEIHGIPKQVSMPYENWVKCIHPEDQEKIVSVLAESIESKSPRYAEFRIVRPNGKIRFVRASATILTDGNENVTNSIGLTVDITERKKTEQEILEAKNKAEENQEKFKGIFDFSPQPISITNMSGKIIEANNKLCTVSGYTKDELVGSNVLDIGFYSPEDREKFLNSLKEKGRAENLEFTFYGKNHITVETLMNATFIKIKGIKYILSMVTDISKRKKTENELLKAKEKAEESDRLKTEFINNLSHEIRTPMNGILGFSQLLCNNDITEEKQKNYIRIIRNSGKQLLRIIDDILEISKLGTKQVKAINSKVCLNDLFLELFSIFDIKAKENKTPLYLKKGLSDKESTIKTDSSKLSKILSNLLENAVKFTNTGSIEFGYYLQENKLHIYVKDTGIGILKEKQNIIFERFSQEEKGISEQTGGLGLGLSIAKENAELLGGTISLKSKKGEGSTFYIIIPYNPADFKAPDNTVKKNNIIERNKTILIVEDEEVNYIYIETLLEYFNKDIIKLHAKDGKQAVKLCREREDIDVVLMDLKMPVMDGYEATKEIKKFRPDLPIIAQTAYSTPEEKEKALLAGCDDFISKPISKEIFSKVINKYKSR